MAAAGCRLTKHQLLCSVCRDVFADPVSTPCGHNFCKACVAEAADVDVPFQCPVCMKMFYPKPELQVNTLISEVVAAFRRSEHRAARQEEGVHVLGFKPMLLLLCLLCVSFLWDCRKSNHPLDEGSKGGKLERMEAEIQQMIEETHLKMEELKRSVQLSAEEADREVADGVQVFDALKESAERGQAMLLETIRGKQRRVELQGEEFIRKLQQDINELKKRKTSVELLSVIQLKETLSEEENILEVLARAKLRRAQSHEVEVTLNPDTANQYLVLSDDGKLVFHSRSLRYRRYNPGRFYHNAAVLGLQGFSSGRFYFEVLVEGSPEWDLGVATQSIDLNTTPSPADGFWTVGLRNRDEYKAGPDVHLCLQAAPDKVGVLVDYEEGLVSFYDVDAAALIYSFTGCSFTEELHPYFRLNSENSVPLIISPVDQ